MSFLADLCKKEEFGFKVTDSKIVIFDEVKYEKEAVIITLSESGGLVNSYSFKTSLTNTSYAGCRVKYRNAKKGTVRVLFDDKDNLVSDELQLLDFEYDIPPIGEQVICFFLPNGIKQGFCLKGFYSDINKPPVKEGGKI